MGICGIAHTAYNVSNIERSLEFYCDGLGMERMFELKLGDGRTLIYLRVCPGVNQFLELFHGGAIPAGGKAISQPVGYEHLCLEISDLEAFAVELRAKGLPVEGEPTLGLDHNTQLWISDPDGNRIELMQYGEDALQLTD